MLSGWYLPYICEHGSNAVAGDTAVLMNSEVSNLSHWQAAVVAPVKGSRQRL